MIWPDRLDRISARAVVPEQIICYVKAVGGGTPRLFESCLGYEFEDSLVLIGYPLHDSWDEQALRDSLDTALAASTARRITVLAASCPLQAIPETAKEHQTSDFYLSLPIPGPAPGQKLRNMLRRAGRELHLEQGRTLEADHTALIRRYVQDRFLTPATRHIFENIPAYLAACPGALLISARLADGRLAGYTIGDFSSLTTAFYMFAFRNPEVAPPGTADLLLHALLQESEQRGQQRINLGLGITPPINYFKRKWGAVPFLPYHETSWERKPEDWLQKVAAWWRTK
jgi:hypothetical protein